jgi:hypothetical protein
VSSPLTEALYQFEAMVGRNRVGKGNNLAFVVDAAFAYEAGEDIWWCEVHESRSNPVLDAEHDEGKHLEMWGGCHNSLWSFASGLLEDKVGRCRMVSQRLCPPIDQKEE